MVSMADDPAIHVRPARGSDASALRAILYDTVASTWLPQLTAAAAQAFRDEDRPAAYVGARGLQFWVAESDGQVVGFVDWEGAFVNALHVRVENARTGVGGRLMDKAEAMIAADGFAEAWLETDTFNLRSDPSTRSAGFGRRTATPTPSGEAG